MKVAETGHSRGGLCYTKLCHTKLCHTKLCRTKLCRTKVSTKNCGAQNRKGRDLGYGLAGSSCEGVSSVDACTVTAP